MIFGTILTKSDIESLQSDMTLLSAQMNHKYTEIDLLNTEINELKSELESLQKFCYNIGAEISTIKSEAKKQLANTTTD
jgi:predicted  nucleic acid-binding Zn-ribbon protein